VHINGVISETWNSLHLFRSNFAGFCASLHSEVLHQFVNFIIFKIYNMQELLNIRFTYLCRTSYTNENDRCPIVLRIIFRRERRDIFTGLYCLTAYWDNQNKKISKRDKSATAINKNLELIVRKANNVFDEMRFSGTPFTIDELVDKIKGKEDKPILLIDFLEQGNQKILKRVGSEILKITYLKYKRVLRYMKEFLQSEYKVRNFSLQKVNSEFMERYFQYLLTEKVVSYNTACKYISCIKSIFSSAIRNGLIKSDPFYGLKIHPKPVYKEFLTQDEIDKIAVLIIIDPYLDIKRDIFLFSCYTGLAYVDLKQLNGSHLVKEGDNSWYIRKPRQKTGQDSIIPLLPAAIRILSKYCLKGNIASFNWYISSNQKMNKGLKLIGTQAGITKSIHMHLARHTFATTVTLSNGVPLETVSKMLGHASIKQTQHYAKMVPMKIKFDMEKIKGLFQ
jgi:site-specific recombinase XerD